MKKSLLVFPLALVLVACSSNSTSDTDSATSSASSTEWQPASIQPTSMPSSMNQSVSQPNYNSIPQTSSAPSYSSASSTTTETVGNCTVVRSADGTPVYSQINKGCYTGSTYTVGRQDTLYLIGYLTGTSAAKVASMNGLSANSRLSVGKVLRVK